MRRNDPWLSAPARVTPDATLVIASAVVSAIQFGWFWLAGGPLFHTALASVLASLAIGLVLTRSRPRSGWPIVAILIATGANLVLGAGAMDAPVPGRILLLVLVVSCFALSIGTIAATRGRVGAFVATFATALLAAPVVVIEIVLAAGADAPTASPYGDYARPPVPDQSGGYAPLSVVRVSYPQNVGGYLDLATTTSRRWELGFSDTSSAARLVRLSGDSVIRVEIDRVGEPHPWGVQLRQLPVSLERGLSYHLSFRARAFSRRTIAVNVNSGREPWTWLGLAETFGLDSTWQRFDRTFVATESDSAAWLRFDLGGDKESVELRDVALVPAAVATGDSDPVSFRLEYAFDSLGCRGPIRTLHKDTETVRVLALGDSYTLGAGVTAEDAWPARLEALLNGSVEARRRRVQVFNCAAVGAGTIQQRDRFRTVASQLQPDLVIVGVVLGDDQRGADDVTVPVLPLRPVDRLMRLPRWWRLRAIEKDRYASTRASIATVLETLAAMDTTVRGMGARFAVLILQDHSSRSWNAFTESIENSAALPEVPVLGLGDRIRIFSESDRYVLPPLDMHPSRTIHRVMAEGATAFVRQYRLLEPADTTAVGSRSAR